MVTLEDLETRIAAIAASQAELLAVITSVEDTQRVLADALRQYSVRMGSVESTAQNTNHRIGSVEESLAEIEDLLGKALGADGPGPTT
jgi:chromosome segregation ATPase